MSKKSATSRKQDQPHLLIRIVTEVVKEQENSTVQAMALAMMRGENERNAQEATHQGIQR